MTAQIIDFEKARSRRRKWEARGFDGGNFGAAAFGTAVAVTALFWAGAIYWFDHATR